jgi:hypothetical protein
MALPEASRSIQHLLRGSSQAAWRLQRQWIGALLVTALGLAMVASLYLDVTSQAAIAGRQIQEITTEVMATRQTNADLQTKLAQITSTDAMEVRAAALGYQPVDSSTLEYVLVAGFQPPVPTILLAGQSLKPSAAAIPPAYSESLISWLDRQFGGVGVKGAGGLP